MYPRPHPFDLVFSEIAQNTFPTIRSALERTGTDPRERDGFLMVKEAVGLIRDLRPEEGLGEGIDQLAALIHHAYLFWDAGQPTVEVSSEGLPAILGGRADTEQGDPPPAYYAQLPEHRVWAQVIPGQPHEPLDGCFVHFSPDSTSIRVLGIFGIQPEREGFSVVEAAGPRPAPLVREDGTAPFSPTLPGGAAARLFSLAGAEELLELGWRVGELGVAGSQLPAPSS